MLYGATFDRAEFALGSGLDRKIASSDLINNHRSLILDCCFLFVVHPGLSYAYLMNKNRLN